MIGGYVSAAILAASGLAGVVIPRRVGAALDTDLSTPRGRAEYRIAYGAMAAVGIWALVSGTSAVFAAVGWFWLGAAGVRLLALAVDRPQADWTYWAYLALEVTLGAVALLVSG